MKDKLRELADQDHKPVFGDWIRGIYASESNPQRDGMYVRTIRRTGRLNPGTWYELTDGKGHFWQYENKSVVFLDAEGDGGAVGVSQEDRFEQFVAAEIARSPEPLRELGEYLTRVLDEDQWPTANRLLLQLATETHPARSGVVSDEDVEAAGQAYFEDQWVILPPRSKAIYRRALRRSLESYERNRK